MWLRFASSIPNKVPPSFLPLPISREVSWPFIEKVKPSLQYALCPQTPKAPHKVRALLHLRWVHAKRRIPFQISHASPKKWKWMAAPTIKSSNMTLGLYCDSKIGSLDRLFGEVFWAYPKKHFKSDSFHIKHENRPLFELHFALKCAYQGIFAYPQYFLQHVGRDSHCAYLCKHSTLMRNHAIGTKGARASLYCLLCTKVRTIPYIWALLLLKRVGRPTILLFLCYTTSKRWEGDFKEKFACLTSITPLFSTVLYPWLLFHSFK